jgi:hypothetical protein
MLRPFLGIGGKQAGREMAARGQADHAHAVKGGITGADEAHGLDGVIQRRGHAMPGIGKTMQQDEGMIAQSRQPLRDLNTLTPRHKGDIAASAQHQHRASIGPGRAKAEKNRVVDRRNHRRFRCGIGVLEGDCGCFAP